MSFEAHCVRTSGCAGILQYIVDTLFVVPGRRSLGVDGRARRASRTITEPIIALTRTTRIPFETLATLDLPRNSSEFLVDMTKGLALGGELRANGSDCFDWIGKTIVSNYRIRVYLLSGEAVVFL